MDEVSIDDEFLGGAKKIKLALGIKDEDTESEVKTIDDIKSDIEGMLDSSPLYAMINEDACGTVRQLVGIFESIMRIIDKSDGQEKPYDQEDIHDQIALVPVINSFRLDCANCLNADCKRRDPSHPFEEVEKRIPKDE